MHSPAALLFALIALLGSAAGAARAAPESAKAAKAKLHPIDPKDAKSTHGPFESGECSVCHKTNDASNPGPLAKVGDPLCFDCHDEFLKGTVKAKHLSHPAQHQGCLGCHNPHNSQKRALLVK